MQASNIIVFIITTILIAIAIRSTSLFWNNEHRIVNNHSLFITADLEKAVVFFALVALSLIPALSMLIFAGALAMATVPTVSRRLGW